jgi:tRNA/rRNA methyltransferase|uniref:tRNA (cytidine/uridine-2'-O-)-methyltransferase TrmJ n=1 Tax=Desulfobacca acetoxidans TaxID=60893 RepID=A0A7V6DPC4_9BACT
MKTKRPSRSHDAGRVNLDNVAIVLFRPQIPENIGAVARAACNMGISRLHLVEPLCLDEVRLHAMATPAAAHLLEKMVIHEDLGEALGPFQYVVGTTARLGGIRKEVKSPREMAARLIDLSRANDIALLFGPENFGLTNKELRFCHALVTIDTSRCSSLNLAQAVMVLAYELHEARTDTPRFQPRLANTRELETMYAMLQETLVKINYIGQQNPEHWMLNVRRLFNRHGLLSRETQVIKGICRQIDWYVRTRLAEGKKAEDRDTGESAT